MSIYMDIMYLTVAVLLISLTAIISITLLTEIQNTPQYNTTMPTQGNQMVETTKTALHVADYATAILLFGTITVAVISSAFINSHPLFFIAGFITMLIFATTSTIFSVMYNDLASHPIIATTANTFTWTILIFQNLPLIGLIAMVAIAIATHGKPGGRQ